MFIFFFYFLDYLKMNQKEEEFDLEKYIDYFVYSNWKCLDYFVKVEDLEIEIEDDDEITEEELFYKDIVYNEY